MGCSGPARSSAGRSAPLTAARTPGARRACSRSILAILAAATGLSRRRAWARPGSLRSAVKRAVPVTLEPPSSRRCETPITGIASIIWIGAGLLDIFPSVSHVVLRASGGRRPQKRRPWPPRLRELGSPCEGHHAYRGAQQPAHGPSPFHRTSELVPTAPDAGAQSGSGKHRPLRGRHPQPLALARRWSGPPRRGGRGLCAEARRAAAVDPRGRHGVYRAGRGTLAWRRTGRADGPCRGVDWRHHMVGALGRRTTLIVK